MSIDTIVILIFVIITIYVCVQILRNHDLSISEIADFFYDILYFWRR
jgi:hypothetical protein